MHDSSDGFPAATASALLLGFLEFWVIAPEPIRTIHVYRGDQVRWSAHALSTSATVTLPGRGPVSAHRRPRAFQRCQQLQSPHRQTWWADNRSPATGSLHQRRRCGNSGLHGIAGAISWQQGVHPDISRSLRKFTGQTWVRGYLPSLSNQPRAGVAVPIAGL